MRWLTEEAVVELHLPVGVQTSEAFSLPHRRRSSGSGKPRLDIDVGTKLDILFSKGWTCDRWSVGSGRVAAAAWAPDSLQLVFATTEEPVLYCLSFQVQTCSMRDRYNVLILKAGAEAAVPVMDLTMITLPSR